MGVGVGGERLVRWRREFRRGEESVAACDGATAGEDCTSNRRESTKCCCRLIGKSVVLGRLLLHSEGRTFLLLPEDRPLVDRRH